jgi:Tripartite tricarboxylate transporter TctB family
VNSFVRSPKDFWTGMIYLAMGVAGFVISREYSFGTAGRMGPGYFPNVIAGLLVLFGAISLGRSFLQSGEPIGSIPWKAMVLILGAVISFGFLLPTMGLVVAMVALVLLSAAASQKFRFEWGAVLGLVGLVIFCSVVFVKGLGVPMPLVGSWLEPMLPAALGG